MTWERVDRWPGDRGAEGAFRGGAEPVIAERGSLRPSERFWVFWHSTPEHPLAQAPVRLALTGAHLYVERAGGEIQRVRRDQLHGVRRMPHRIVVGVAEGDDLVMPRRSECALQRELVEGLSPGAGAAWEHREHVDTALQAVGGMAAFSVLTFASEYAAAGRAGAAVFHLGVHSNSFWVLCGGVLASVATLLWLPRRVRVDRLGVEVRRGLVPWLVFFAPRERVGSAGVRHRVRRGQNANEWVAELRLRQPMRLGTLSPRREVRLRAVSGPRRHEAAEVTRRVLAVLGIEGSPADDDL